MLGTNRTCRRHQSFCSSRVRQISTPKRGSKGERQRVEGSFETILELAEIQNFRFHDLRHTFASWYMMNGGDLYELAKILGHANIKITERYAKAGQDAHREHRKHGARNVEANGRRRWETGGSSSLDVPVLFPRVETDAFGRR